MRKVLRYLKHTKSKGTILTPNPLKGLEVYVDVDFAGNWDPTEPENDADTARSRHGYIIKFKGCTVVCKSQLQTEITLSSTEAEYTGLSYALREAIPLIDLINEINSFSDLGETSSTVKCNVFEDNSGALETTTIHKYRPRTKHINCRLHHFRTYVNDGTISIKKISTHNQIVDILTKPLPNPQFKLLRKEIIG